MTVSNEVSCLKGLIDKIIFTCEHGGNRVPPEYRHLFTGKSTVLNSHRGWDAGALELAKELSRALKTLLISSETTRLLVDLNRSLHHQNLFSEFSRHCDHQTKARILREFYLPYRQRAEAAISKALKSKIPVIHFSIHSFAPKLDGVVRNEDIGLLYDPARTREKILCMNLQSRLQTQPDGLIVRRNYPYRGNADGLTTTLRKQYNDKQYAGIEIEINQKHVMNKKHWKEFQKETIASIMQFIHD